MKRAEKQALATLLGEIAGKLEGANANATHRAEQYAAGDDRAFYPAKCGVFTSMTEEAGRSLRAVIATYLTPKKGR